MALNGRLEDMNLLEILQIVAFSKKTGTLRVESSLANGAILFRQGRVLCAVSSSASSNDSLAAIAGARAPVDPLRTALLDDLNRASLRELVGLREGTFEFQLRTELPRDWEGLDVSGLLQTEGLDPQELMLELARELDESRKDTRRLLESSGAIEAIRRQTFSPAELDTAGWDPTVAVVVVDDERPVVEAVSGGLADTGSVIECAGGPSEALALIGHLVRNGNRVALVTDLAMPTSTGESFEGGFEIVEQLRELDWTAPVLLMVESLSAEARARARELGIGKVAFKPALTKLDMEEYRTDLAAFAGIVRRELTDLVRSAATHERSIPPEVNLNHDVVFDFLKTMTDQLTSPSTGIARMILRVASKYVERALLFLVKQSRARGLAGVQDGHLTGSASDQIRSLSYELQEVQPFAEAVYSREPAWVDDPTELWISGIEPGNAREFVVFPLMHFHEVLAVLYCDNPTSGAPLGKLAGLQLFMTQAGMALENASLHRKLRSLESRYSLENQGPLTQALSPIARRHQ